MRAGFLACLTAPLALLLTVFPTPTLKSNTAGLVRSREKRDGGRGTLVHLAGYSDARNKGNELIFKRPSGIVADNQGNLYVADDGNACIRKVVVASGAVTTLAGNPESAVLKEGDAVPDGVGKQAVFLAPRGLVADNRGNLYVGDGAGIRKIVVATGAVTTVAGAKRFETGAADGIGNAARFNGATGLALDGKGNLYVVDRLNYCIRKVVLATGQVSTLAGSAGQEGYQDGKGSAARFNMPLAAAVSGEYLYVLDSGNGSLRKIAPATGVVTTVAGTGKPLRSSELEGARNGEKVQSKAGFGYAFGVVADKKGNLYVTESFDDAIRKIVVATNEATTVVGKHLHDNISRPNGIAVDDKGTLYWTDDYGVSMWK
jgi:sugar lactone lactonase YvrE